MEEFNLMTIPDFAKKMGRGKSTVYDWKNNGTMPANCFKKVGGTWYVRISEAKEFLAA